MSSTRAATTAAVEQAGIVAVIRIKEPARLRAVVDALAEGGLRAIEVTMTVPGAIGLIAELSPHMPEGFLLGAGTVTDADTARRVVDAGARYIVSPVFRRSVMEACHSLDVAGDAGVFLADRNPRRVGNGRRRRQGLPGDGARPRLHQGRPRPAPQVKLMPTGGVTLDNAGDWIRAGAVAVGVGTALTDATAIAAGDYAKLRANAERIVANVRAARATRMKRVVTFGEIMLRLSPPGFERFLQSPC